MSSLGPPAVPAWRRALPPLVVFLLAVVTAASFRSLAPASVRQLEATDFRWYRQVAENLEAGRGLTFEGEQLAVRYPPGYPIVLAAGSFGSPTGPASPTTEP